MLQSVTASDTGGPWEPEIHRVKREGSGAKGKQKQGFTLRAKHAPAVDYILINGEEFATQDMAAKDEAKAKNKIAEAKANEAPEDFQQALKRMHPDQQQFVPGAGGLIPPMGSPSTATGSTWASATGTPGTATDTGRRGSPSPGSYGAGGLLSQEDDEFSHIGAEDEAEFMEEEEAEEYGKGKGKNKGYSANSWLGQQQDPWPDHQGRFADRQGKSGSSFYSKGGRHASWASPLYRTVGMAVEQQVAGVRGSLDDEMRRMNRIYEERRIQEREEDRLEFNERLMEANRMAAVAAAAERAALQKMFTEQMGRASRALLEDEPQARGGQARGQRGGSSPLQRGRRGEEEEEQPASARRPARSRSRKRQEKEAAEQAAKAAEERNTKAAQDVAAMERAAAVAQRARSGAPG
jgi:hypothetical protein